MSATSIRACGAVGDLTQAHIDAAAKWAALLGTFTHGELLSNLTGDGIERVFALDAIRHLRADGRIVKSGWRDLEWAG